MGVRLVVFNMNQVLEHRKDTPFLCMKRKFQEQEEKHDEFSIHIFLISKILLFPSQVRDCLVKVIGLNRFSKTLLGLADMRLFWTQFKLTSGANR